ncbi:hypothetical protein CB1_000774003 [Camelus ferus]|nr:hypothetical protein CB1_000774003 [Camelus ferus]
MNRNMVALVRWSKLRGPQHHPSVGIQELLEPLLGGQCLDYSTRVERGKGVPRGLLEADVVWGQEGQGCLLKTWTDSSTALTCCHTEVLQDLPGGRAQPSAGQVAAAAVILVAAGVVSGGSITSLKGQCSLEAGLLRD